MIGGNRCRQGLSEQEKDKDHICRSIIVGTRYGNVIVAVVSASSPLRASCSYSYNNDYGGQQELEVQLRRAGGTEDADVTAGYVDVAGIEYCSHGTTKHAKIGIKSMFSKAKNQAGYGKEIFHAKLVQYACLIRSSRSYAGNE